MTRPCFTIVLLLTICACATTDEKTETRTQEPEAAPVAEPAPESADTHKPTALTYVKENLVGHYSGQWELFGLDANDQVIPIQRFTDTVAASQPRVENNRAIVDVKSSMDMGGEQPFDMAFIEGVEIEEDGTRGLYFVEIHGQKTIYKEIEPGVWQSETPLSPQDMAGIVNVTPENLVKGTKTTTKVVSHPDGQERHDITTVTYVEYANPGGQTIAKEFTSMKGFHQRTH